MKKNDQTEKSVMINNYKKYGNISVSENDATKIMFYKYRLIYAFSFFIVFYFIAKLDIILSFLVFVGLAIMIELAYQRFNKNLQYQIVADYKGSDEVAPRKNITTIRAIVYSFLGIAIITISVYQNGFSFQINEIVMIFIGIMALYQGYNAYIVGQKEKKKGRKV